MCTKRTVTLTLCEDALKSLSQEAFSHPAIRVKMPPWVKVTWAKYEKIWKMLTFESCCFEVLFVIFFIFAMVFIL